MLNLSKVASLGLLLLDRNEKTLEVTCSKTFVILSLDDFKEQSRPVLKWLRENLQQISFFVIVD